MTVEKEDGQNDYLSCQLKSTDAQSIKVNQKDIRVLEYNAAIEHKVPVFAIQFLNTGEVWLMAKPEDLKDVSEFIETGKVEKVDLGIDLGGEEVRTRTIKCVAGGNGKSRVQFYEEQKKRFDKTRSAT